MKILVYAINFAPELTGCGKYTGEMVDKLIDFGHEVRVVTAQPYYPEWKVKAGFKNNYNTEVRNGYKVFRSPMYIPKNVSTIKRLVHLISFAVLSLPQLFRNLFWKPDFVFMVEPTFFCAPATILFSWLTRAKSWLHIQDFELDAMVGVNKVESQSFLLKLAQKVERFLLRRFSLVSTISSTMVNKLVQKGVDKNKTFLFPNWVDINFVTPEADKNYYRHLWGYENDDIIFLYSGNIGKKQGLGAIFPLAKSMSKFPMVKFVVVGEGLYKEEFIQRLSVSGLDNIKVYGLQPYEKLPNLLRMANFHLILQLKGAADVVLPSKLTSILAAGGTPIITADENTELGQFIKLNPGIGHLVEPEEEEKLKSLVEVLISNFQDSGHNIRAREYAVENLSIDSILQKFNEISKSLISKS